MTISKLMVSVVVPVYNVERYLEKCIASIQQQTLQNIEIICVNDGSTDSSGDMLKSLAEKDDRIILLEREKASGSAAVPRNIGLSRAKGKYIIFLDADDYFDIRMLELLVNRAELTNADVVLCDNYRINPETEECLPVRGEINWSFVPNKELFNADEIPETIFQVSNAAGWHRLLRREYVDELDVAYQENVKVLDDIFFVNATWINAKRISIIPDKLVFYRTDREGAQTTNVDKNIESVLFSLKSVYEYLKLNGLYNKYKDSFQKWELDTLYWWATCVQNESKYEQLISRYREEYFDKLGLDLKNLSLKEIGNHEGFAQKIFSESIVVFEHMIPSIVKKMEGNMVLYGAGRVGRRIYKKLDENGWSKRIYWCDKDYESLNDIRINNPREIVYKDIEYVVIAIRDYSIVQKVWDFLAGKGISKQKTIVIL